MAKTPIAGEVKTRLAKKVGSDKALKIYKAILGKIMHQLIEFKSQFKTQLDHQENITLALSVNYSSNPRKLSQHWDGLPRKNFELISQGEGDLGRRMLNSFQQIKPKQGHLLLMGSDIPFVTKAHLKDLLGKLDNHPFVLGPCPDGGFWCLGVNTDINLGIKNKPLLAGPNISEDHIPDNLFAGVRWSTEHALADTLEALKKHFHLKEQDIYLGQELADIDELKDIQGTEYEKL